MKLLFTFLLVTLASATLANEEQQLPENFIARIQAIIKWIEIRTPVYEKANTLLKQLTRKVDALPPFNSGIQIYYYPWVTNSDPKRSEMQLMLGRTGATNGTTKTKASELLKDMLKEQEVKHVLTMMPEVRDAFRKLALH